MNSIERLHKDSKSASYKTTCSCHDDGHDLTIWVDNDPDFGVNIFFNVIAPYPYTWDGCNIFVRGWHRVRGAIQILCTGRIVYQDAFSFRSKAHINDFIAALNEGMNTTTLPHD